MQLPDSHHDPCFDQARSASGNPPQRRALGLMALSSATGNVNPIRVLVRWLRMKIALIAMSGVRVCNEELTRVGMTLPGFVERSKVIASLPSLSLLTLAGMTPDRFDVEYHEIADL